FNATCICRCVLAWLFTTPKEVESRLVDPVPKTTRLNRLNASQRKSRRRDSLNRGKDFPTLMFSFRFGNARTLGLNRVTLPNAIGCAGNTLLLRNLSTAGSKLSPFSGARQLS